MLLVTLVCVTSSSLHLHSNTVNDGKLGRIVLVCGIMDIFLHVGDFILGVNGNNLLVICLKSHTFTSIFFFFH